MEKRLPSDLLDLVLSWSLNDIFNENLYKDKVENIPPTFHSDSQYLGAFIFPLLEETRVEFCSSLEAISTAPFADITHIVQNYDRKKRKLFYDIWVSYWQNKFITRNNEIYDPSPGDILILSDRKFDTVSDLSRYGSRYVLISITKIKKDDDFEYNYCEVDEDENAPYFTVYPSYNLDAYCDMEKYRYVIFLLNITTNCRIWKSLSLGRGLNPDSNMIKKVLTRDSLLADVSCDDCPQHELHPLASEFAELNDSQTGAILDAIATAYCNHRPSVKLIWGQPGTGKTKTLSALLWSLSTLKYRVLTCTPTNVAIREVASRVLKLARTDSLTGSGDFSPHPLGHIVLLGNAKRLKIDDDLKEIYLDYRVKRLLECLCSRCGWKYHISSMTKFLECCVSEYHLHQNNSATFLGFMREKFGSLAFPLRTCMVSLCTHMTPATVTRKFFEDMIVLVNLLDSFGSLLGQVDIGDKELEEKFIQLREAGNRSVESVDKLHCGSTESSNLSILYNTGNHLMYTLYSLHTHCNTPTFMHCNAPKLRLNDRLKAQNICLNQASLIFCTASTSFRLHLGKPFDLLIIDEASQLKESESTIPLQLQGIKHAILIGDECQLPATVKSKVSENAGFGRSLFERLSALGHPKHLLEIQYRMHPSISLFPNASFYSGRIIDGNNVKCKSYEKSYIPGSMYGAYSFINVDGKEEHVAEHGRRNMAEVGVVLRIVHTLYQAWCTAQQKLGIGIISPYAAQVAAIQEKLKKYQIHNDFMVSAKSVDGFQGGEEDVIIISTVRSNAGGYIGFLSNRQRANVALTRARHCLWIVGSGATLAKSGSVWESLVHNAKQLGCFFNAYEDNDLAKVILQVEKEIDQMDDLLNKDSILFRNALWKVLFSGDFMKSFRNIKSTQLKKGILNLLMKLAGGWRPKRCNVDTVTGKSSQLIKQFKIEGMYIICTVDIMKYSNYTQVLKVWDILPLSEIPKLIKRLDSVFLTYTDDYVNRSCEFCSVRNTVVPAIWDSNKSLVKYKSLLNEVPSEGADDETVDTRNYVENSKVSESLLLMKFYSLTSGAVNHLLSDYDGKAIDLPFEVTDQERDIILYPRTSFILGRSGTGKTTVLTMKLIQKEQLRYLSFQGYNDSVIENYGIQCKPVEGLAENENFLRQLFVTVSPKLCSAVRDHILRLKSFVCGGEFSAATTSAMHDIGDNLNAFSDIPDSFSNIPIKHWPLVITFQKFLIMLDGSLENSFFEKYHDGSGVSLEGTGVSKAAALQALIRQKEVTYTSFTSLYWPHFNARLTKNLDSSIVFTEIISHKKGGLKTNEAIGGKLSREDYVRLSEGRASSLNFNEREVVYDIFLDYEKKKLMNRELDLSDLVNDLHHRVRVCSRHVVDLMGFVYVDEVQDLTMRQISLFRYVCKNFAEGFVFAGDTAQTIARGIDFRFQDIRSLFYSVFLSDQTADSLTKSKAADKSISDMFQLNQNFRTHAGVLKLSQSVIDILYFFFPCSVDRLQPETSLIFGEPPILLESGNDENGIMTLFGNCVDHNNTGLVHGFGADQVVLVRDEYSKQKISGDVGKQALVLTILECKGLEFQDVLLYNFFGDSPLKNHWRVVYDYMNSHNLLDSNTSSFRSFEMTRHNILCSELKQLYVAITRTRQRLWICENVEDYSKPMFDYWKKLCLVQVRHLDVSITQAMFVTSSNEEWRDRGIKLFNEGNYEMATYCFERAGDVFREQWSRASGLRASAERIIHSNSLEGRHLLTEAAEIYESIGKVESAASCYIELKNFERAGSIYLEKCGESRLQDAGDCFSQAKCWLLAANAYAKGKFFSKCLSVCSTGKLFDEGLRYIENWRGCRISEQSDSITEFKVDWEEIEFPFLERCSRYYHELKDSKRMMKFVNAFNSINKARGFLLPRGYLDELLSMEEELGNFIEAANLAKMKGEILLQADMLEKAGRFDASFRLVLIYVVAYSLRTKGSTGWPLKAFEQKEDLLERAKSLAEKSSKPSFESMNVEISILEDKENGVADLVKILNVARRLGIVMVQVFAARKILDIHINSDPSEFHWDSELDDNPEKQARKMQQNLLSSETLACVWNIWKEKICSVLDSLGNSDEHSEDGSRRLREFCIDYFGLQRNNDRNYIVYHPDAFFLREGGHISLKKDGRLSLIENDQFISAARSYWVSELLSVGTEVLGHLETLSSSCTLSGCRGTTVLRIFQLSKFLIDFQLDYKKSDSESLQNTLATLATSKSCFFDIVFPIDWRLALTENNITLREHDLAKELFKELINDSINDELTYGKISRVAMICTVSGKLDEQLDETILNHLNKRIPWKTLIEQLRNEKPGCGQRILVASSLRDALRSTFDVNWQNEKDYISPPSFLYLLERLLFLVSARQPCFFVSKSSFAEALGSDSWCCCFEANAYDRVFFTESVEFFAYLFQQILFDQNGTIQWIVKLKLNVAQYYPLLVLKLIIMLGVVYINSGLLLNMLVDVLKFKNIIRVLPKEFYRYLQGVGENTFHDKFAAAVMAIGDPLVMVTLTRDFPNITRPNCLSIDMSIKRSREDIMNMLFPKNSSVPPQSKPPRESRTPEDTCISSDSNVGGHEIKPSSDLEICKKKTPATDGAGEDYDLQKGYDLICSTLDALLLVCSSGGSDYSVVASELKTNVENYWTILASEMSIFDRSTTNGDDMLIEFQCLLDELIELETVLDGRGNALAKTIHALNEVKDWLKKSRLRFQPLFTLLKKREICNSEENSVAVAAVSAKKDLGNSEENSVAAAAVSAKKDLGNKGEPSKPKQQKKNKKKGWKGRK